MRKRALLPFLGTSVLGLGVVAASWPDVREGPRVPERAQIFAVSLVAPAEGAGADRGWLGAEVLGVDLPRGTAIVFIDGEERVVRGTPAQLLGLAPGDAVNLRFRSYGSETWLWPPGDAGDVSRFTTFGTLTGPVEGVDPFRGALRVGGHHLLAHPDDVASLLPGERISLRFARVGDVLWALELERDRPSGAGALTGAGTRDLFRRLQNHQRTDME